MSTTRSTVERWPSEEAVQDAFAAAVQRWPSTGLTHG